MCFVVGLVLDLRPCCGAGLCRWGDAFDEAPWTPSERNIRGLIRRSRTLGLDKQLPTEENRKHKSGSPFIKYA